MKKLFFLLNSFADFNFSEYLHKHVDQSYNISFGETMPSDTDYYDLIVLWNYQKIVKDIDDKKNIVVFHSTNLPDGKGWAPIFNSLLRDDKHFYITGILASNKVDAGDIIVQAKFEIKANYTAKYIRIWDIEICIILANEILKRSVSNKLSGVKQKGKESYNHRRQPQDNEINLNVSLKDQVALLRACEDEFPAFFFYRGEKYIINIEPESKPVFPEDLEIAFFINP
jgi:methionyl-tRNA formyltransferase